MKSTRGTKKSITVGEGHPTKTCGCAQIYHTTFEYLVFTREETITVSLFMQVCSWQELEDQSRNHGNDQESKKKKK
jgi:hypothetical protein